MQQQRRQGAALMHGRVQRQGTREVESGTTPSTESIPVSGDIREARVRREREC
jgi:hypothetical protein